MHASSDPSDGILFDLVDQLLCDVEDGGLRPLGHYLARFPGHDEEVAREYLATASAREPASAAPASGAGGSSPERQASSIEANGPERIGPFRIVRQLGRGGQGVVYLAEDARFRRTVAVKVLGLSLAGVSEARKRRFEREARIVARLDHPGTCAILEADLDGQAPYIAMRYVEGETLASALELARETRAGGPAASSRSGDGGGSVLPMLAPGAPLELADLLTYFERAARALHAVHEVGVVHRDVKPGNLMVSLDGSPVILDFGLARSEDEESVVLTRAGEVFGTPAYMSPEQLQGGRTVDRRTDVYSLGVVLYEALTLEQPFSGDTASALADAIRRAPAPDPRRWNPALPSDLVVVLETALERDVARRYPTAFELAEELRRVREYEPIRARPAGPLVHLSRWTRRNPVLATVTLGSIVALSLGLSVTLVLLGRVREERNEKESALGRYEAAYHRDRSGAALAQEPVHALETAIRAAELEPGFASNRALLDALESDWLMQDLSCPTGYPCHVEIAPGGDRLVSATSDGIALLWDPATGEELARYAGHAGTVFCVRFDPDGRRFVTAGADGTARIFSADAHDEPPVVLAGHPSDVEWAEFSPDGVRVVTAGRGGTARLWDARTGAELVRLEGHTGIVSEARFIAGGTRILTRSGEPLTAQPSSESDRTARIWDARSGALLHELAHHGEQVRAVAASTDGRWVVTASVDRTAHLYRIDERTSERPEPVHTFQAPGKYHAAAFSPDGTRLVLAYDAGARVIDVETGRVSYELPSHDRRAVVSAAFSPDGERLATAAYGSGLRIFDATDGALLRVCRSDSKAVRALAWSPDGRWIATWYRHPRIDIWYARERPFLQVLRGHAGEVRSARFDARAERVVTASADGTARVWSVGDGSIALVIDPDPGTDVPLTGACFDARGASVALTDEHGLVRVVSADDGRELLRSGASLSSGPPGPPAFFSPDGELLCAPDGPGALRLFHVASGRSTCLDGHAGELTCARFSADGRWLVTGGRDRCIALWEIVAAASELARPIWRSDPYPTARYDLDAVFDVAFDPIEPRVAAALQTMEIAWFGLDDGRRLRSATVFTTVTVGRLAFRRDGRVLLGTAKWLNTLNAWQIAPGSGEPRLDLSPMDETFGVYHTNSVTALACAAAADVAVTGSLDGTARLWSLEQGTCLAAFDGHADAVWDVDVSADGALVATASADGTARIWPTDLLGLARRVLPRRVRRQGD